jgi:hypothetical protein
VIGLDGNDALWVHILSARLGIMWLTLHGFMTAFSAWAVGGYDYYFWQARNDYNKHRRL